MTFYIYNILLISNDAFYIYAIKNGVGPRKLK